MEIWLDLRTESDQEQSIIESRVEQCNAIVLSSENADDSKYSNLLQAATKEDYKSKPVYVEKDKRLFSLHNYRKSVKTPHVVVGTVVDVSTKEGQAEGLAAVGSVEWILADSLDWRMIPAENLVVAADGTTNLAFCVTRQQDIPGLTRALELGVDALCVPASVSNTFWQATLDAQVERSKNNDNNDKVTNAGPQVVVGGCQRRGWEDDSSSSSSSCVLADRVCVDLVQLLEPEEGCWIGSSAKVLALVLSEAALSSLVPSRPFRVNAGPVHSYVLLGDGQTTKYLSELRAGDHVAVHHARTHQTRSVAVGRLKIEKRPCLVLSLLQNNNNKNEQDNDGPTNSATKTTRPTAAAEAQIFLQQAETVRLGRPGGEAIRVTDLPSDSSTTTTVWLRVTSAGTHIGKSYRGQVEEK